MEKIEIIHAIESDREAISYVFADAFIKDWSAVSNDKKIVAQAIRNGLVLDEYIVATLNNEVVAFIALVVDKKRAFKIPFKDFQKHFGYIKGYMLGKVLKNDFEQELVLEEKAIYIDILGVLEDYRKKGFAGRLIEYIINNLDYNSIILNVTNINQGAIHLYKKYGFQEIRCEPVKFAKQKGFSELIYFKYSR